MELNLRERTLQQLYRDVKEAEALFGVILPDQPAHVDDGSGKCAWCGKPAPAIYTEAETETPHIKKCGKPAQHLIAGASWFLCCLPEGHEGPHEGGGNCFTHGEYIGIHGCPKCFPAGTQAFCGTVPAEAKETIYILRKPDGSLFVADANDVFTDRESAEKASREFQSHRKPNALPDTKWTVAEFVAR
jgi:hypothetical protein